MYSGVVYDRLPVSTTPEPRLSDSLRSRGEPNALLDPNTNYKLEEARRELSRSKSKGLSREVSHHTPTSGSHN